MFIAIAVPSSEIDLVVIVMMMSSKQYMYWVLGTMIDLHVLW